MNGRAGMLNVTLDELERCIRELSDELEAELKCGDDPLRRYRRSMDPVYRARHLLGLLNAPAPSPRVISADENMQPECGRISQ